MPASMTVPAVRGLLEDIFEEQALALGGLVAIHEVEDQLVWRLVRNMDAVRSKALRRLEDEYDKEKTPDGLKPHPAIDHFLRKVRMEGGCGE